MNTLLFIATFIWLGLSPQTPTESSPNIKVVITSSSSDVKVGGSMKIEVTLTALTTRELSVSSSVHANRAELEYRVSVWKRLAGKSLPLQTLDRKRSFAGSEIMRVISKGDQIVETSELNKIIDTTIPGTYEIVFSREDPGQPGSYVKSNGLMVTIVP